MQRPGIKKPLQVLLIFALVFAGMYYGKSFLVPVCFAGLFAMLFLPVSRKFEKAGINRALSTAICLLIFLLVVATIIFLVAWQVTNLTSDLGNIEDKVQDVFQQVRDFIAKAFGISLEKQQQMIDDQSGVVTNLIARISYSMMDIVVNFILVLVYFFLFMYYRTHLKKFILKLVPQKEDANAEDAIVNIEKVAQRYMTGMGLMIISLWIMYGIGFTLIGLKNAFFFALLCGIFEIVPYVGNFTGNILAALMAFTQGGGLPMIIGVLITYSLVQTIQTYLLEPLVVGSGVNINPLFTIIGLVLGELVWGISGLILAIPLLAIVKIICDHTPSLKPYGYLIGREKNTKASLVDKVKILFGK